MFTIVVGPVDDSFACAKTRRTRTHNFAPREPLKKKRFPALSQSEGKMVDSHDERPIASESSSQFAREGSTCVAINARARVRACGSTIKGTAWLKKGCNDLFRKVLYIDRNRL